MRKVLVVLVGAVLALGARSLVTAQGINGKGKGHSCEIKCDVCTTLVDLTPQNKNDCNYVCQPIVGCIAPR